MTEAKIRSIPLIDLYARADEPTPWLVEGLIPESELVVLYGKEHVGKTYFLLDLGLRLAAGLDFWSFPVPGGPKSVLYVPSEGLRGFDRRLGSWLRFHIAPTGSGGLGDVKGSALTDGLPFARYVGDHTNEDPIALKAGDPHSAASLLALRQEVARLEAEVVIVDVASDFTSSVDENSVDFGHAMKLLHPDRLAYVKGDGTDVRPTVILVHHEGKGKKGPRGSSKLPGVMDVGVRLEVKSEDPGVKTVVSVENTKQRNEAKFRPWSYVIEQPEGLATAVVTDHLPDFGKTTRTLTSAERRFLTSLGRLSELPELSPNFSGVQISKLADDLGVTTQTASGHRNSLQNKEFLRIGDNGRSIITALGIERYETELRDASE